MPERNPEPIPPMPLHILVVEDDDDARESLRDILELDHHQVIATASANEALAMKGSLAKADVIILDRSLPDGLAEELLPKFRRSAPTADVIIITGNADLDSTIAAIREGASDYIIKPINPQALLQRLYSLAKRRHIEDELHEEREFATNILRTAEAIILVLDRNGTVVRCNRYLTELSGYSSDEIVGKNWFETFIPERDRERIRIVHKDTLREVESRDIINPILTKEGVERDIRWSNTLLRNEQGQQTGVLAVGLDVTDLAVAQKQLLQSERLAAIGQTMAGMAHESRNALQRIQNGIELLEDDFADNPSALRDLKKIQRACDDLRNLLEEVRSYAAPIHLSISDLELPSVWKRAWADLELQIKGRCVKLVERDNVPGQSVPIDRRRMEQVFRNIFENSLDACDDPVELNIECDVVDGFMRVAFQDNGPGIPNETKARIFDAFFTSKPTGTGLGLSIVFRIIEAHGGRITIAESKTGSRFEIMLPLSR